MCDPREEIEILLRYGKHPGIVTLKNVYEDSRKYYLVLQLLKGGDLLNYMMKRVCILLRINQFIEFVKLLFHF